MIEVEDDLDRGEDNKGGVSLKPRKGRKRRMGDRDLVGSLRNMMMAGELGRFMTAVVEGMKVGDPIRVTRAGLRNGGELGGLAV
jgi:hypothetical protein